MDFLIINDEIIKKEEANLTHLFWDEPFVISQKIWFGYGGIPLFDKNLDFLYRQLEVFNIEIPEFLKNKRELFRITKRMLNKNKFYRSGIVTIQLFVNITETEYVITSIAYPEFDFPISTHGLIINFSNAIKSSDNQLNRHQFYNRANWRINRSKLRDSSFQNSIILNQNGMICEGIGANIFMIKENVLITPSIDSGCFEHTIKNTIFETATLLKLKTAEIPNIKKEHVVEMDEVFFASEEFGIQWILGIENKRFVPKVVFQIHEKLNKILKEKVD